MRLNMNKSTLALALILLSTTAACDEEKAPAKDAPAEPAAQAGPTPEQVAEDEAQKKAAEEAAKKAEEEAKAQAALAENPLTECCRSLGQKGFTLRSPEYMGASKICGTAMEEKKQLADILADIKKELKDKELPQECAK